MFEEIMGLIGQADTAVSGLVESFSTRIAAAEANAITPEQGAAVKAQLMAIIDGVTKATVAATAPAQPAPAPVGVANPAPTPAA